MNSTAIKKSFLFRSIAYTVLTAFIGMLPAQPSFGQVVLLMPQPGQMLHVTERFEPPQMIGMKVNLKDPFSFNFIMDQGQDRMPADIQREEFNKIIKYFLVSLAMPNKDMWVNLSPYESQRIIPQVFAETEMGRDLLAQDYVLKQFTASLIYPEEGLGKKFWAKVYKQAQERFGRTDINVNTFNKVWIIADKADIYQKGDTAFLVGSHLKVMLDEDYQALEKHTLSSPNALIGNPDMSKGDNKESTHALGSQIVREIIIPAIEKEVNEGKSFATVRQAYGAEIMATWFKKTLRESLLGQVFADKGKIAGQMVEDPQAKEKIYHQYLRAYKKGVFNYIKEDVTPDGQAIPRKYFSGGLVFVDSAMVNTLTPNDLAMHADKRQEVIGFAQRTVSKAPRLALLAVAFATLAGAFFMSPSEARAGSDFVGLNGSVSKVLIEKAHVRINRSNVDAVIERFQVHVTHKGKPVDNINVVNQGDKVEWIVPAQEGKLAVGASMEPSTGPEQIHLIMQAANGYYSEHPALSDKEKNILWPLVKEQYLSIEQQARDFIAGGFVDTRKFSDVASHRDAIVAGLSKNDVGEKISDTELRLKPNLDQKKDVVRKIVQDQDEFDEIWAILQQSRVTDSDFGRVWNFIKWFRANNNNLSPRPSVPLVAQQQPVPAPVPKSTVVMASAVSPREISTPNTSPAPVEIKTAQKARGPEVEKPAAKPQTPAVVQAKIAFWGPFLSTKNSSNNLWWVPAAVLFAVVGSVVFEARRLMEKKIKTLEDKAKALGEALVAPTLIPPGISPEKVNENIGIANLRAARKALKQRVAEVEAPKPAVASAESVPVTAPNLDQPVTAAVVARTMSVDDLKREIKRLEGSIESRKQHVKKWKADVAAYNLNLSNPVQNRSLRRTQEKLEKSKKSLETLNRDFQRLKTLKDDLTEAETVEALKAIEERAADAETRLGDIEGQLAQTGQEAKEAILGAIEKTLAEQAAGEKGPAGQVVENVPKDEYQAFEEGLKIVVEQEFRAAEGDAEQAQADIAELRVAEARYQAQAGTLQEEINLTAAQGFGEEQLRELEGRLAKTQRDLASTETGLGIAKEALQGATKEIDRLAGELEEGKKREEVAVDARNTAEWEKTEVQTASAKVKIELAEARQAMEEVKQKEQRAQQEVRAAKEAKEQAEVDNARLRVELERQRGQVGVLEQEKGSLSSKEKALETAVQGAIRERDEAARRGQEAQEKVQEETQAKERLLARVQQLEAENLANEEALKAANQKLEDANREVRNLLKESGEKSRNLEWQVETEKKNNRELTANFTARIDDLEVRMEHLIEERNDALHDQEKTRAEAEGLTQKLRQATVISQKKVEEAEAAGNLEQAAETAKGKVAITSVLHEIELAKAQQKIKNAKEDTQRARAEARASKRAQERAEADAMRLRDALEKQTAVQEADRSRQRNTEKVLATTQELLQGTQIASDREARRAQVAEERAKIWADQLAETERKLNAAEQGRAEAQRRATGLQIGQWREKQKATLANNAAGNAQKALEKTKGKTEIALEMRELEVVGAQQTIEDLNQEIQRAKEEARAAEGFKEQAKAYIKEEVLASQLRELEAEKLATDEGALQAAEQRAADAERRRGDAERQLAQQQVGIDTLQERLKLSEGAYEDLNARIAAVDQENARLQAGGQAKGKMLERVRAEAQDSEKALQDEIDQLNRQLKEVREERNRLIRQSSNDLVITKTAKAEAEKFRKALGEERQEKQKIEQNFHAYQLGTQAVLADLAAKNASPGPAEEVTEVKPAKGTKIIRSRIITALPRQRASASAPAGLPTAQASAVSAAAPAAVQPASRASRVKPRASAPAGFQPARASAVSPGVPVTVQVPVVAQAPPNGSGAGKGEGGSAGRISNGERNGNGSNGKRKDITLAAIQALSDAVSRNKRDFENKRKAIEWGTLESGINGRSLKQLRDKKIIFDDNGYVQMRTDFVVNWKKTHAVFKKEFGGFFKDIQSAIDKVKESEERYKQSEREYKALQLLGPASKTDAAMAHHEGGINLSNQYLTLNIKVDGSGMPRPLPFQDKAMINLKGLTSIILQITPLTPQNLPELYELVK